jgi:hypothetical protein
VPRRNPPSSTSLGNIVSQNPSKDIISPCRKSLQTLLNNKSLNFSENQLVRPLSEFTLHGEGATEAIIERKRYSVLPLPPIGKELYWLGLILQLKFEAGFYYLSAVSIAIVKGLAQDSTKTEILRAEWDCLEENLKQKHAQPHWHIYPSSIIKNWDSDEIQELMTDPLKQFGEQPEKEKFPRFHFAMATRWHLGEESPHAEPKDVDSIIKWIEFCTKYTIEQLTFMWKL